MSHFFSACPLCSAEILKEVYRACDSHYGIPGEYSLAKCMSCSLVFTNPMLSEEELVGLYPATYYAYQDAPKISAWKQRTKKVMGYWQGTKEPRFALAGRFLDIGCGIGNCVQLMHQKGWDAYGVEINTIAANIGQAKGRKIIAGNVQKARFPSCFFDYVRASHSLEHMPDPHEALREINRILKPDGTILIAVPNIKSINAQMFGHHWWHLCPPVHTFSYSPTTLSTLLEQHSFEVKKVVFNSDYVGVLGSLQIWLNRENHRKSSDGWIFQIRLLRIIAGWIAKMFDLCGLGDMIEITAVKAADRERGRPELGAAETEMQKTHR